MRMPTVQRLHRFVLKQVDKPRALWRWYPDWVALLGGKYRHNGRVPKKHCGGELAYMAIVWSGLGAAAWISGGSVLDWIAALVLRCFGAG